MSIHSRISLLVEEVTTKLKGRKDKCWNREYDGNLMLHWEFDGNEVTDIHIDYNGIPFREVDCRFYKNTINKRLNLK